MLSTVSAAESGGRTGWWRLGAPAIVACALPLLVFLVYAVSTPGLPRGAGAGTYITAANLIEHGRFTVDGYLDALLPAARAANAPLPGVAYAAGHYYQSAPPGLALVSAPLYVLGAALAPLLGPESPAFFVVLLGPLLGAVAVALLWRAVAGGAAELRRVAPFAALGGALFLLPLRTGPTLGLAVVVLALGSALALRRAARSGRWGAAFGAGLLLGAGALLDYLVGAVAALALVALVVVALVRWRRPSCALALAVGGALGFAGVAAWQTLAFGYPWRLAFRSAADPAARGLSGLFALSSLGALLLGLGACAFVAGCAVTQRRARATLLDGGAALSLIGVAVSWLAGGGALALPIRWWSAPALLALALPIRWWSAPALLALAIVFALLLVALIVGARGLRPPPRVVAPLLLACSLALPVSLLPSRAATARAAVATEPTTATNYAAPFALDTTGGARPLWTFERGQGEATTTALRLGGGAVAVGPWLDVWPGEVYALRLAGEGQLRATFDWEDVARASITTQSAVFVSGGGSATFAAPPGAAGLRLRLEPSGGAATARDPQLTLAAGVRVEPFPDGRRAALAFSFDWESAMGGLIHTRSDNMGEAGGVALGSDGGPSVSDAEAKGRRMRDGARFLAGLFARYGIKATFYATGYNLLDGNPTCQKFNGDPIYRNADAAHGWGSDWWRTHPWYQNDPCTTEARSPAWYFASETRELAAAGHEIASHSFGHLYVRGVTPDQLAADLELWQRTATALGLPASRSFAFPWTSSNSLDAPFWAVFERVGMTVLTRLYQTKEQPLRHPYELDRIAGDPNLLAFPDFYLASNAQAENEALARIDVTVAVRGYHSLWDHPNESLEQRGQAVWTRVVDYTAARRDRGLWIAPVTEIATYSTATRTVDLVALPLAGGTQLTVTNGTGRALDGLTVSLAGSGATTGAGVRTLAPGQVAFPTLAAGAQATATVR